MSSSDDLEHLVSLIVAYLARQRGVQRIWLFGSLAKGRAPDSRSDIDIAVEGSRKQRWGELVATRSLVQPPLDLTRYQEASETLKTEIEKWGRLLYATA